MALDDLIDTQAIFGGTPMKTIVYIVLATVGFVFSAAISYYFIKIRKKWNIPVEFKIPRDVKVKEGSKGEEIIGTLMKEWGKGRYDAKMGIVMVKRKGRAAVPLKPFDIKAYLSGPSNILTVVQVGVEDYRPVLDESYINMKGYDGKPAALIQAKIDTSESKSWRSQYERSRKSTYTILGWMHEYGHYVGWGFVIMMLLIGQAIVIGRT